MKKTLSTLVVASVLIAATTGAIAQQSTDSLNGDYLGQTPPGQEPKPFAPGMVSTEGYEYSGTFSPQMDEFYYVKGKGDGYKQDFVMFKREGNSWTSKVLSKRVGQPFVSPDGKTMHLGRRVMKRDKSGWSKVAKLAPPFDEILIMRMTSSNKGTYFFDTYDEDDMASPMRYSPIVDGKRQAPKVLAAEINKGTYLNHPFIAPDESYLIWDAKREEGFGDSDLYISYRQPNGEWGKAINLGNKINSAGWDAAGHVSPDGKYFFFNRLISSGEEGELPNVDIYWVSASFIEDLKPDHLKLKKPAKTIKTVAIAQ